MAVGHGIDDRALERNQRLDHAADVVGQFAVGDARDDVIERSPDVRFEQVEDVGRRRGEIAHAQVVVEEQRGDLRRFEQVLEIRVDPSEFLHAVRELAVDGLQFLVDRLQFLLRGFHFLVGQLQLFVDRLVFLVGRLEVLVGGFELLDRRFQAIAHDAQLGFEPLHVLVARRPFGIAVGVLDDRPEILEDHDQGGLVARDDRLDVQRHAIGALGLAHHQPRRFDAVSLRNGAGYRAAQIGSQVAMDERDQVQRGGARDRFEITAGTTREMQHVALQIDHDEGGGIALGDGLGHAGDRGAGALRGRLAGSGRSIAAIGRNTLAQRKIGYGADSGGRAPEQAVAAIDRGEQFLVPGDVLRCAEKQQSAGAQREMEDRDDAVLQVGVEVDQQIAARQQIDPRKRRVLDDVVRREDAQFAQRSRRHSDRRAPG